MARRWRDLSEITQTRTLGPRASRPPERRQARIRSNLPGVADFIGELGNAHFLFANMTSMLMMIAMFV
jgi:hypothetical protein